METQPVNFWSFFKTFFPIQLVIAQFKHNLAGIVAWLLLFLICTGSIGNKFGIPILFFSPEYLGKVSFLSFGLLGFSFGGLLTAFNTYSYGKLGKRFAFLILVKRPFIQFSKNNSFIPILFFIVYLIKMALYQWKEEYMDWWSITGFILSFISGVTLFIVISLIYFFPNFRKRLHIINEDESHYSLRSTKRAHPKSWYHHLFESKGNKYLYFGSNMKLFISRSVTHINDELIHKILIRNKINTSVFEFLTILLFISVSLFPNLRILEIPAAMSIVLIICLVYMLFSIIQTWIKGWTPLFFVALFLIMNQLSQVSTYFSYKNYAYGLNYSKKTRPIYSINTIEQNNLKEAPENNSLSNYIEILENWKQQTGEKKPKLVIVNSSGGGLRSALWTFNVLQKIDKEYSGDFKKNIHLYTGASGGLIGAAYFREICLRAERQEINSIYSDKYYKQLGQDMLNKLAFSASTRDLFLRVKHFQQNGNTYPIDRGKAFEDQLNANTKNFMKHELGYYVEVEKNATVPMLIATPTIVNDGRRLLMSTQPLQFLTQQITLNSESRAKTYENIDYLSFFKTVDPLSINFSTILRASATFPFVTPMVTMPTTPEIQLMDAGIRDNYGGKLTIELLTRLQDWIKKNTSGVVILQIRDTKKILKDMTYQQVSLFDKITLPFGNLYSNFPRTQDFDQEQLFHIGLKLLPFQVDVISFNLREKANDQISLSWHLSTQEKTKIQQAFYSELNQQALNQFKTIVK